MVFQKGDMKGDPVLHMYDSKEDLIKALKTFPMVLHSIFNGIKKEVWTPNAMVCDSYCSVQKACIGEASSLIDQDMIDEAKKMAKQLNL